MKLIYYTHMSQGDMYAVSFAELEDNVQLFIRTVQESDPDAIATDKWTVKEVLCHIVFWHENYAANYGALAMSIDPPLLSGPGYRLNPDGVASLTGYSVTELIDRLLQAQKNLARCILVYGVPKMTYKKNGRVYTTPEFLHLIARHFRTHALQVKRASLHILK
jgi:hypothetical protein